MSADSTKTPSSGVTFSAFLYNINKENTRCLSNTTLLKGQHNIDFSELFRLLLFRSRGPFETLGFVFYPFRRKGRRPCF